MSKLTKKVTEESQEEVHLNEDSVDDADFTEDTQDDVEDDVQDDDSDDDEGGLFEAIQSALNQDDTEEDPEEIEEEETEETEEEPEEEEEELENQDGSKPTVKTSEFIKSLKQEISKLKEELSSKESEDSGRLTELEEQNKKLQEEINAIAFSESDDFKNKYVKPLSDLNQKLGDAIKSNVSDDDIPDVESGLKKIDLALSNRNEAEYFKNVDDVLEYFGPSASRRISGMLDKVWEVTSERYNAEQDLKETRNKFLQDKVATSNKAATVAEKEIIDAFSSYEREIQQTIDLYRKPDLKDKFKYDELTPKSRQAAIDGLKHFANTGEVPHNLKKIIIDGIMGDVHLNEKTAFIGTIKHMEESIAEKDEKIKSLQSKLKKMGVSMGTRSTRQPSGDNDESEYGIAEAVAAALR